MVALRDRRGRRTAAHPVITQLALWELEPCDTGPAPQGITEAEFADWLHAPATNAIPPGAGRGSRRRVLFRPVVDVQPLARYL